ncbi:MAG: efflux RND transporter permease subunit [Chitinophagaceae bacterium]
MNRFFITYKSPLAVLLVVIIFGGFYVYEKMQTSLFPEITFPKIKIIADAGLQPVDRMMIGVTKPLENAVKQVPDLEMIRSTTSRGSCEISAFMSWSSNIDVDQQHIESKISEIRNQLPAGANISVAKMNPSILPVMGYSLESNTKTPIELKLLATYTVKPFLSQVAGVAEIRVTGGKTKEYWVEPDLQKMSTYSITPEQITTILSQTGFIQSNGFLSDYKFLYLTVTDASVHNMDDLENLVVRNDGKRIIRMKDISTVKVSEAVEFIKINANGQDGVLVAVIKQPNANLVDLSSTMLAKIEELKKILPKDVHIRPFYVQADFVNDSVKSVKDSLWIGLLLAIVVAIIFLRSLKASVTILVTIPVTLFLTLVVLYAIGYTLNIMTLGAIAAAIGLIIDDAIVVMEQIHRTHEEHPDEPPSVLVQKAIHYLFPAMVGSSLSTIVIFIPFLLMTGVAGAYFGVMTSTMLITLICSFMVSWLGLPVIYLLLLSEKRKKLKEQAYSVRSQRWVSFVITKPWISAILCGALIAGAVYIYPKLQTGFLPEMDEGSIVLDYTSPPGTSLEETDRMLRLAEAQIKAVPEVQAFSRRTGTQLGFFITEPNDGDYLIQLKKDRSRTTEEVITDIRKRIEASQPALRIDFGQVIGDMLGDLMESVQPIEIKIFGDNQEQLQHLSKQVAEIAGEVTGTADIFDGIVIAGPSVAVEPNYQLLAQFGITPSNLQFQLQSALEGNIIGNIYEREQILNVRFVYPNSRKLSVDQIGQLKIFLPDGRLKPIQELATVTVRKGDAEIKREDLQSMGVVTGRLEGRDLGSVMKEIRQKVSSGVSLPAGYHIEYGGSYAQQQQSFHELLMILVTASLLVFSVILFLYKRLLVAVIILSIAVLGVGGSYLSLWLTGTPLNVGSYTGIIMIVGIIGENAIFTYLQFSESLATLTPKDAVIYSISTRLRPKLMTALGAIIALLPLGLGIGTGAELHQPLAIAVIGGFITALPLLLIVLPTLLYLSYKNKAQAK